MTRGFDARFGDLQLLVPFTLVWRTARLGQMGSRVDLFWEPNLQPQLGVTGTTGAMGRSGSALLLGVAAGVDVLHVELVDSILDWHALTAGLGYQVLPAPQAQASLGTGLEYHPWGHSCGPARNVSFWITGTAALTRAPNDAATPAGDWQWGRNVTIAGGLTVNLFGTERPEETRERQQRCAELARSGRGGSAR
jgi:hypothetical protein